MSSLVIVRMIRMTERRVDVALRDPLMTTIHLPSGGVALVRVVALHRRRNRSRRPYSRPTDWLAHAGNFPIAWGRTRREAVAKLMDSLRGQRDDT